MYIGKSVLAKHNGIVKEFKVTKIMPEDLELNDGEITIIRKFWEIRKIENKNEEKKE
jgi:hypothetical protein